MNVVTKIKEWVGRLKKWVDSINHHQKIEKVIGKAWPKLSEALSMDKEEVLKFLKEAKDIEQTVATFSKWADKYWIEAILSWIPCFWDIWPALFSTCFLFYYWRKIWLKAGELLGILLCQTADFLIWGIPFLWNIVDFFFKSNQYSSKLFSKYVNELEKIARNKWISDDEIQKLGKKKNRVIWALEEIIEGSARKIKKSAKKVIKRKK